RYFCALSLPDALPISEAAGIARGVEFVGGENEKGIGAFHSVERVAKSAGKVAGLRTCEQVHNDFGVAVGLKNRSAMLKFASPLRDRKSTRLNSSHVST